MVLYGYIPPVDESDLPLSPTSPLSPETEITQSVSASFVESSRQSGVSRFKCSFLNRGSYMSAHVLLNLLNKLGKRDKMRDLPSILSLFRNEFNKFINTRARMLDSIYHMTNTLKSHFWCEIVMILSSCMQRCYGRHNVSCKSVNHYWFISFIAWRYFTPRRNVI